MAMLPLREHGQRLPSFDTRLYRIPSLLLTQTGDLHLVQLSDLISIYNQTPSDNLDRLKQELYRLRRSVWRFFYLDYDSLIKSSHLLLDCQHEPIQQASFYKNFVFELNKVRDFCSVKGGEIDRRLAFMKNGTSNRKGMAHFMDMHDAIDELTYDIHDLWHFIKLNYRAFLGIVHFLDMALENAGQEQVQHNGQTEINILLQKLYRLLAPNQFLDWNLYLHWSLDLGRLYQDQLGASATATMGNYNSSYDDNNGSSPPSPPHTLIVPRMTRESSNASTGSLPSSTAPPSPTSTSPSHNLPTTDDIETGRLDTLSREHINRHNTGDLSHGDYDRFSLSSPSSRSTSPTDWIDNSASASLATDANRGVSPTAEVQDSVLKFWIHPDNLLEVTMYLAKYMSVMRPGQISSSCPEATFEIDSPEHQAHYHDDSNRPHFSINNTPHANATLSGHHYPLRYWQSITTLYLDASNMKDYTNRIQGTTTSGSDSDSGLVKQQTAVSTLRLRHYNNTSGNKKDTDDNKSATHFYALEKKIYTIGSFPSTVTTLTGSRTSTRSSSDSSKKLGKKPYLHRDHRHQQLRRQRSASSTTSTTSTLSSAPSVINSDQDKSYYGNHCLHHQSSSPLLGVITKPTTSSIHGRIWLKSKRCRPWLKRQWSLKNILVKSSPLHHYKRDGKQDPNKKLIEQQILDMEANLHEQQLEPVLRTSLNRIGFKWTGDHTNIDVDHHQQRGLTVTIDTDITMVRSDEGGDQLVGKDPLQQQEYLSASRSSNSVSHFPFAVLQIKLPHDFGACDVVKASSLPWLDQLLSCPLLEPVQDFSLYLHGVSTLLSDKVDIHPEWYDKMELDLRQVEHQGYLSGPRRVYRLQQQRHYSTRSSRQESTISDQNTPWSFITGSEATTSSAKGGHSPDRALEPTESSVCPPLHPLEDNITPAINYFTCITTTKAPTAATTTPAPTLQTENNSTHRKPSIILSPAPLSSSPVADEHTPLLPSPIASMKSGASSFSSIQCRCSSTNQPGSSAYQGCGHCAYQKQSMLSPSSSFDPLIHTASSSPLHRSMHWIQPHIATTLEWFRAKRSGKQQQACHDYVSITIPDNDWAANPMDGRWEEALVVAKRPIPLTLLCGAGSFVVAYVLYLLVSFL